MKSSRSRVGQLSQIDLSSDLWSPVPKDESLYEAARR